MNKKKIWQAVEVALWLVPIAFFTLVSFMFFPNINTGEEGKGLLGMIIPFVFLVGTTVLAWWASRRHYLQVRGRVTGLVMLAFVPLAFLYSILVEFSFNYHHLLVPGRLMEHLTHHIFEDVHIFAVLLLATWLFFRKYRIGWRTVLFSYVVGVIFQWFFADGDGEGPRSIIFGLIWVWLLHVNWFLASLLIKNKE